MSRRKILHRYRLYRFVRKTLDLPYRQGYPVEPQDLYVGITNDVRRRLFEEHFLDEETDSFKVEQFNTVEDAREVEAFFLEMGLDGGEGGGDVDSVFVYIYLKSETSDP